MKQTTLIIACFIATQSFAQSPKLNMGRLKKYMEQNRQQQGISPDKFQKSLSPLLLRRSMFDTAQFSHTTPQGNVFVLPYDGIPCLKPGNSNLVFSMPNNLSRNSLNQQQEPVNQMPNAYTGKPLILINPGDEKQPLNGD
ncbi:MAG: hypothetical protein ABIX01_13720 [Chitinophagaceae bacterium]